MADNNITTYRPAEMAEEILALKSFLGPNRTDLDTVDFGQMSESTLYQQLSNPGLTDPKHYEAIAEALNEMDNSLDYRDYDIFAEKTIDQNGDYVAFDDNTYGYSMVRVRVPETGGITATVDGTSLILQSGASVNMAGDHSVLTV